VWYYDLLDVRALRLAVLAVELLARVVVLEPAAQRESYRVGPKVSRWPKILTVNPY
jgi:hypothetical protein